MKVLTVMLLLGPLAGFAWMWSQCYLAQLETSRLREENVRLRQQVEYTTRINHNFAEGNARGNQAPGFRIIIETVETVFEPFGNGGATPGCKAQHLWKARDGQDSRHYGRVDPRSLATITEAQEQLNIVEELRDRAGGARVDLAFEIVEIELS